MLHPSPAVWALLELLNVTAKDDHILVQRGMNKAEHPSFCACIGGTTKLQLLQPHLPIRGCGRQRGTRVHCGAAAAQRRTGSWERQD